MPVRAFYEEKTLFHGEPSTVNDNRLIGALAPCRELEINFRFVIGANDQDPLSRQDYATDFIDESEGLCARRVTLKARR